MIIDADEAVARAQCEETFRAARCEGHNLLRPGAQRERPGQIVHGEARTQMQRGALAEAPPGLGRGCPRKDLGMDDLGQNLESLDDPRTRAIEIRRAVYRIDPSRLHCLETAPFCGGLDMSRLLYSVLQCDAARHEDYVLGTVVGDAAQGGPVR